MIKVQGISKQYIERRAPSRFGFTKGCSSCGNHEVFSNVNTWIKDGELVCILGPSGCGKSTFLNILAGFEKPDKGKVLINDKEVVGASDDSVFVFQHSGLLPWLSVWGNIELALHNMPDGDEKDRLIQEYIEIVDLKGFEMHKPHELSGGMRRRAELARAMVVEPKILIMDEPFTGLDFVTHMKMREEIVNMHQLLNHTMVIVTHFIEDALIMADRVIMFGGHPSTIKLERYLDIERPRNIDKDEALVTLKEELYKTMGVSYVV